MESFPDGFEDGTYITDEHGLYRVVAANKRTFEVWLEDCMDPEVVTVTLVTELLGFRVVNQLVPVSAGLDPLSALASNGEAVND